MQITKILLSMHLSLLTAQQTAMLLCFVLLMSIFEKVFMVSSNCLYENQVQRLRLLSSSLDKQLFFKLNLLLDSLFLFSAFIPFSSQTIQIPQSLVKIARRQGEKIELSLKFYQIQFFFLFMSKHCCLLSIIGGSFRCSRNINR